jgi:hypothetical protein
MTKSQTPRSISFKLVEGSETLDVLIAKKGPLVSDFYKALTAAALAVHERDEDPIEALLNWPMGGLESLAEKERALKDLLGQTQLALREMQSGLGALWPTLVAAGAAHTLPHKQISNTKANLSDTMQMGLELIEMARAVTHALDRASGLKVPMEPS